MIKVNTPKPDSTEVVPEQNPGAAQQPSSQESVKNGDSPQKLADEAEEFCADLERFFRRAFGEVPKAVDLGEIRAQQATVRNLVHRAAKSGGEGGEKLASVSAERDKLKDAAARARADFLNYQSRSQKDLERAEEQSLRKYILELLPVLDSFDLALQDARNEKADINTVRQAMEMIHASLNQVLAVRGLERIAAKGKTFDPTIHEAVAKRAADTAAGEKSNQVVEELRLGYLWKGLVLRPVQVLVAEAGKS